MHLNKFTCYESTGNDKQVPGWAAIGARGRPAVGRVAQAAGVYGFDGSGDDAEMVFHAQKLRLLQK